MTGPLDPNPPYLTAQAEPASAMRLVEQVVTDALRPAIIAAAEAVGATVTDPDAQTERQRGGPTVTFDVPGAGRVDVLVVVPAVRPTTPPGWQDPAKFTRGDVLDGVDDDGARLVVVALLGSRTDPRPGYAVAAIGNDPTGRPDPGQVGRPRIVTVAYVERTSARPVGRIDLGPA